MNICIYGAASKTLDKKFIESVENLGQIFAERGHNLIFGGGKNGLMGAAARGFEKGGCKSVVGIAPKFFNTDGVLFERCSEYIYPDTMRERKALLEERSDAFVAVPGGIGTLDELFEIATLRSLGQHSKPIVLFNVFGFFNPMLNMLDGYEELGFLKNFRKLVFVSESPEEIAEYLENYNRLTLNVEDFKNV